jgi:hypothetical protein
LCLMRSARCSSYAIVVCICAVLADGAGRFGKSVLNDGISKNKKSRCVPGF